MEGPGRSASARGGGLWLARLWAVGGGLVARGEGSSKGNCVDCGVVAGGGAQGGCTLPCAMFFTDMRHRQGCVCLHTHVHAGLMRGAAQGRSMWASSNAGFSLRWRPQRACQRVFGLCA